MRSPTAGVGTPTCEVKAAPLTRQALPSGPRLGGVIAFGLFGALGLARLRGQIAGEAALYGCSAPVGEIL
jgi:hypothetical protein